MARNVAAEIPQRRASGFTSMGEMPSGPGMASAASNAGSWSARRLYRSTTSAQEMMLAGAAVADAVGVAVADAVGAAVAFP